MNDKDIPACPQSGPLLGLGSSDGLGPLPQPFGWLHDGLPNGGLAFQRQAPDGFAALAMSTMPVYSYSQMLEAVAAERERCATELEDMAENWPDVGAALRAASNALRA